MMLYILLMYYVQNLEATEICPPFSQRGNQKGDSLYLNLNAKKTILISNQQLLLIYSLKEPIKKPVSTEPVLKYSIVLIIISELLANPLSQQVKLPVQEVRLVLLVLLLLSFSLYSYL